MLSKSNIKIIFYEIKIRALLNFKKLKPADKLGFGTKVINGVTTNADLFPVLPITIKELQAANNAVIINIPLA